MKRVAHVLWRSQGGIRRHVRTLADHPPCDWMTAGVWGPAELSGYFKGLAFHPTSLTGLLRAAREGDLIHAHGITAGTVGLLGGRPPVVVSNHVVVGGSGRTARSRLARSLARLVTARADALVAVSQSAAVGLTNAHVIPPAFEPLPLPTHRRDEVRDRWGATHDDVVAVTVSRLEPTKRLDLFVRAVREAGCVGWIVGDGPEHARLDALVAGSRVRLLGQRPDISEILAAADVFALPSASESYGIAVAEAIGAGLPVVATDTGSIAELTDGAGIVVPVEDTAGFVSAMHLLLTDPGERKKYAAKARLVDPPDRTALVAELGRLYDTVLAAKGRR